MSKEMGYDYMAIGMAFMAYNIATALTVFLTMKLPLSFIRAVIQSVIYFIACVALPSSKILLPLYITGLAIASGLGTRFYETIIAEVSKHRTKTLSIDIGILHIPMRITEFSSLILFSIIVESLGYQVTLILSGLAYMAFSILSYIQLKKRSRIS